MRVVLAEDSVLFRQGLARLLADVGITVAAETGDAAALPALIAADPPDVLIADVRMPPGHGADGLDAARLVRERHPDVGVLVLSHHIEAHHAIGLLGDDARGVGYLLKDRVSDVAELTDALHRVNAGAAVIDPEVVIRLVGGRNGGRGGALGRLSERERQVLALMAEGRSNQAIGRRLHLSPKTVESHVRGIFERLGLPVAADDHRRVLAVLTYLRS
ncbi:LuxR C-terminal-related transcriptional regulator [Actinomadura sp. 9N215]|uniref:response regulator transcription factor n=1 Tax=Actinomadura sp. 9N215 TaxID=3375150 RepID=UPI0037BA7A9F